MSSAFRFRGARRPFCVLGTDAKGEFVLLRLGDGVEIVDGVVEATGSGAALVALTTGEEPPVFVTDGAGSLVYVTV